MTHLLYYTEAAVDSLLGSIEKHLDWYYEGTGVPPIPVGVERAIGDSHLDAVDLAGILATGESRPSDQDADNAVAVYSALVALRPQEAADERLWTHLCHVECAGYVRARWMRDRPSKAADAIQNVKNHFFSRGSGARSWMRDNAIGRLWWLGHIANSVSPNRELEFLEILMHRQDIRSALIERPSVSMNRLVLAGVYKHMLEHWQRDGSDAPLFVRNTFRDWMIRLNRVGGVLLLDALPESELARVVKGQAKAAIEAGKA